MSSYPDRVRGQNLMGSGDPDSWISRIYRSYGAELKRFLTWRLRDRTAAEDVAQEAYLQLHRLKQAAVRHPRALLFVTAANLATRYQQHRAKFQGAVSANEAEALPHPASTPERAVEFDDVLRVLEEVVEAMPDRLRVVWILREIEGLPPRQIAERLDLSLKAVTRRLERARRHCREQVLMRGIDGIAP